MNRLSSHTVARRLAIPLPAALLANRDNVHTC